MDRMTDKRRKRKADVQPSFSYFSKGHPIITMHGREMVYIENFHRLFRLSATEICLSSALGPVYVRGKSLCITCFTPMEIHIRGQISSVSFGGEDRE